ncbi:MAG: tungstate ABC transporter substrate-binding protein WtpA [Methanobrevibacter sp.]|jgi:molybdate/tungstate transport system substrate-binding protein|nr:tungstate ABC transporter substrate-binding protein WtpA [Methanobrevibacter sp.]
MDNKYKIGIVAVIAIAIIGIGVFAVNNSSTSSEGGSLTLYAAASLNSQMNETIDEFKKKNPNVEVQTQYGGSSDLIKKISELNKSVDIFASADYGLIDKMIPNSTTFNIEFARNDLVLAYNDKSKNSSQINTDNWYQILGQDDVKFAIADPNSAPAGYRALMMIQLANAHYHNDSIFEDLIAKNSAITAEMNGSSYVINSPGDAKPTTEKLTTRPDVAATLTAVQTNAADYAFVYKSDAEGRKNDNIKYLSLPGDLAVNDTQYEPTYKNYKLVQFSGTNKSKTITLTPIVYGITVLNDAPNRDLALKFVNFILSAEGNSITKKNFQDPITPAIATISSTNIPDILKPSLAS